LNYDSNKPEMFTQNLLENYKKVKFKKKMNKQHQETL